jgi:hypothetical protein
MALPKCVTPRLTASLECGASAVVASGVAQRLPCCMAVICLVAWLLSPHIRTEPASVDLPSSCRCARSPPQITVSSIHFRRQVHCFYSDASVRGDGLVTAASCWDGRSVPLVVLNRIIGVAFVLFVSSIAAGSFHIFGDLPAGFCCCLTD